MGSCPSVLIWGLEQKKWIEADSYVFIFSSKNGVLTEFSALLFVMVPGSGVADERSVLSHRDLGLQDLDPTRNRLDLGEHLALWVPWRAESIAGTVPAVDEESPVCPAPGDDGLVIDQGAAAAAAAHQSSHAGLGAQAPARRGAVGPSESISGGITGWHEGASSLK
ncbi:hypothetical protein VOLCADRAFT_98752 [Volvox carteri f. nagariensis]|uniref:Uncharacterized protein n=1 Tax=Volvox carteri f. nagariensis TaxID=3068 RepID=D8UG72_VOLCA|nr:uncharacterized protein VOLCADRAFT_98752 [Volvox carteri f. nagariensis]EFJ41327.1 hypothetical protein VOLCADRAFT_98752 [Volvox carteri f. nagariensis]|eukprot:XP_002957661.1 hypothetical protein VOLCADRAFT_98752 [Volvox carteri f. nagariensis]